PVIVDPIPNQTLNQKGGRADRRGIEATDGVDSSPGDFADRIIREQDPDLPLAVFKGSVHNWISQAFGRRETDEDLAAELTRAPAISADPQIAVVISGQRPNAARAQPLRGRVLGLLPILVFDQSSVCAQPQDAGRAFKQ